MLKTACIGLGSNLGDRRQMIETALARLRGTEGILDLRASRLIETSPLGGPPGQPLYLNGAARIETTLTPRRLLALLLGTERDLGRTRGERWGPRTVDLDLLLYAEQIIDEPDLTVPHPRLHQRLFVLEPLAEVAPDAVHPVLGLTVSDLLQRLRSHSP